MLWLGSDADRMRPQRGVPPGASLRSRSSVLPFACRSRQLISPAISRRAARRPHTFGFGRATTALLQSHFLLRPPTVARLLGVSGRVSKCRSEPGNPLWPLPAILDGNDVPHLRFFCHLRNAPLASSPAATPLERWRWQRKNSKAPHRRHRPVHANALAFLPPTHTSVRPKQPCLQFRWRGPAAVQSREQTGFSIWNDDPNIRGKEGLRYGATVSCVQ